MGESEHGFSQGLLGGLLVSARRYPFVTVLGFWCGLVVIWAVAQFALGFDRSKLTPAPPPAAAIPYAEFVPGSPWNSQGYIDIDPAIIPKHQPALQKPDSELLVYRAAKLNQLIYFEWEKGSIGWPTSIADFDVRHAWNVTDPAKPFFQSKGTYNTFGIAGRPASNNNWLFNDGATAFELTPNDAAIARSLRHIIIWSVAGWLVSVGLFRARQALRRAKHRCANCGHELGPTVRCDRCPECGSMVRTERTRSRRFAFGSLKPSPGFVCFSILWIIGTALATRMIMATGKSFTTANALVRLYDCDRLAGGDRIKSFVWTGVSLEIHRFGSPWVIGQEQAVRPLEVPPSVNIQDLTCDWAVLGQDERNVYWSSVDEASPDITRIRTLDPDWAFIILNATAWPAAALTVAFHWVLGLARWRRG